MSNYGKGQTDGPAIVTCRRDRRQPGVAANAERT